MTTKIDIFDISSKRSPNSDDREKLATLLDESPISVFQELSKFLNAKGFMLSISTIEEGMVQ